jgi:hypothetical protein
MDVTTPEMKPAWREGRLLLINGGGAGYFLADVLGDHLAGAKDDGSTLNLILLGIGCYCLLMSVLGGRSLRLTAASTHRHLAASHIRVVGALAFLCGAALGGALAWLQANGFELAKYFEDTLPARAAFFLLLLAAGWLVTMALLPLLLNRRSVQ